MAALYAAGVRGSTLTAITAWKEILLAVALARVVLEALRERRLPFKPWLGDWLALAFAALAVVYALIPQSALGGHAGHHAVALALRHDVVPVGAYFLGRSLLARRDDLRRLAWTLLGVAGFVAALGLVDVYAVSIGWWRTNGVVDYFHRHLGYDYHGTGEHPGVAGLPENFIYNVGGDKPFLRRLVSTFLSPLASGYLFVVALLVAAAALRRRVAVVVARRSSRPPGCCGRSRARRSSRSRPGSSCWRRCGGVPLRARRRGPHRRRRVRLGAPLPEDRADRHLDEGRSRLPARAARSRRGARELQRDELERAVAALALGQPARGCADDGAPPAGLRARQRRARRRRARARRRSRRASRTTRSSASSSACSARCSGSPGGSRCSRASCAPARRAVGGGPRRRVRGGARARGPDRRDRRPLGRVLRLGPRGRARAADASARASCGRGAAAVASS